MAETIEEIARQHGINLLLHFTRLGNLASILERGLLQRGAAHAYRAICNDEYRLDGTDAVCASIGFPNYKMFWSARQNNPDAEWVIVAIQPAALWRLPCAFCQTNAAAATVTAIPLHARTTVQAFQRMFGDFGDVSRAKLNLPDCYPTNPQAEVLLLNGAPREYIMGVIVQAADMKTKLEALHPGLQVVVGAGYFRYRRDFEHWKKEPL